MRWIHSPVITRALAFLGAGFFIESALASGGPPPVLNPYDRTSRSGECELQVNPSDWLGRGPADYRFAKNGVTVWTNHYPFTLWDCEVADSGHVAGFAYSLGEDGLSEEGYLAGPGTFSVVILSPSGQVLTQETFPRTRSVMVQRPPDPFSEGVLLVASANRAIVSVPDADLHRGVDEWWVYDLLSGKRAETLRPLTQMSAKGAGWMILTAEVLPGTPLILMHWVKRDEHDRRGGVYALVDVTAKPVWSLTLDADYSFPDNENRENDVWLPLRGKGGILSVTTNRTFDLLHVKAGQRVAYAAEPQPDSTWSVRETGRVPYAWPQTPLQESKPDYPVYPLRQIGSFSLTGEAEAKKLPLRDLSAFDFDGEGRICALRNSPGEPYTLLLMILAGDVLKTLPPRAGALPAGTWFAGPAHVGGSRFIASVSGDGVGAMARFFLADFGAGTVRELATTNCPAVKQLAGFPDGRFVALTYRNLKYSSEEGLFCFERDGQLLWSREESGYGGQPDELLSPEDVARYGTNAFAVIDNIRHTIQVFDLQGKLERVVDLRKVWGREPSYPTDLAADVNKGFLLYDFNARQNFLRLDESGAIRFAGVPRLADGRPIAVKNGFARSPQGAVWTCDGDALIRLTTNAVADRVLGVAPAQDVLYEAECAAVGPEDRVYVADRKSHVVHVFDASGRPLGICVPKKEDLTENTRVTHIAVSPDRQVFVDMGICSDGYLHFDEQFKRVGVATNDIDPISQTWCFQPSNDVSWIVGYNNVYLVRGKRQEVVRRISRRADGRWLEYPEAAGVAPDGALAVASRSQLRESAINIYSPAGEPASTFTVPFEVGYQCGLAYNGRHVFVAVDDGVLIFKADGTVVGQARLPWEAKDSAWSGPFVASGGREVWLIELGALKVHRFAAP